MSHTKYNPQTLMLFVFIAATALLRIATNSIEDLSLIANFSPVGAMALFGGAYFNRHWKAIIFPLLILFLSDIILHQTVYASNGFLYGGWYWVYLAFVLMALAGRWFLKKISLRNIIVSVLVSVFIHWTVTDLGVWYGSKIFDQNLKGYVDCLILAIPFEWRFLTGTLIYFIILSGLFERMKQQQSILKTNY